jgi:hypothetical protein
VTADRLSVSTTVAASRAAVHDLVSDVTRDGEWSPESVSGAWLDGALKATGGALEGKEKRTLSWTTTSKVTTAEPGTVFEFEMGKAPDTLWRDEIRPLDGAAERG